MQQIQQCMEVLRAVPLTYKKWWLWIAREWRSATTDERLAGLVALTLPLERVPSIDVAGFTLRLSMIFGGLLIIRALQHVARRSWRITVSVPEKLILAFALWNCLLLLFVTDIKAGLQVVLPTLFVSALAISMAQTIRLRKVTLLASFVCLGAIGACLFGVYQFIGDFAGLPDWATAMRPEYAWEHFGFPRVLSTALEPLFFGAYLLLPTSFVLTYFGHVQGAARRLAVLSVAALYMGLIILTVSRGGILALMMLLLVTAIFIALSGQRRAAMQYVGRLTIVALIAVVLGLGFLSLFNRQGQDSDVTYGSRGITTFVRHIMNTRLTPQQSNIQNEDSVTARSTARDYAAQVVTASPQQFLVGVGPGQFNIYNIQQGIRPDLVVANVLPLDIMLHSGFIGLLLIGTAALLVFLGLLKKVRRQHILASALAAYCLAIGLQSLTFPTLYIMHIWFAIGLALIILQKQPARKKSLA